MCMSLVIRLLKAPLCSFKIGCDIYFLFFVPLKLNIFKDELTNSERFVQRYVSDFIFLLYENVCLRNSQTCDEPEGKKNERYKGESVMAGAVNTTCDWPVHYGS